jgi:branched-chain amino acid transport system permease protein
VGQPFRHLFADPFTYNLFYAALVVAIAAFVYWALQRIVHSPWGRVLKSIREDENAAVALGKNVAVFRIQAFVLGAVAIGLAGALQVTFVGFVSPFDFMPIVTFQLWTMLIVGGSGNNRGALLGAFVVWGLWTASGTLIVKIIPPSLQAQAGAVQTILIGLVLVLMLLYRPRGLIGEATTVSRHID